MGSLNTWLSIITLSVIVRKSSFVILPGLNIWIVSSITITTVDSNPTSVSPPSIK